MKKSFKSFFANKYLKPVNTSIEYDPKQLEMGIAVEMEHTNNKSIAETIAKHHLAEVPDYYTKLKKVEEKS